MTTDQPERKPRKEPEVFYLVNDGSVFDGTRKSFQTDVFNGTEIETIAWAKKENLKLQKRFKRSRYDVTVTLYDPSNPEKMVFKRLLWGQKKGKKGRSLIYTDCDGLTYTFYLYIKGDFDSRAPQSHKHEIEFRILNRMVKEFTGAEEHE